MVLPLVVCSCNIVHFSEQRAEAEGSLTESTKPARTSEEGAQAQTDPHSSRCRLHERRLVMVLRSRPFYPLTR